MNRARLESAAARSVQRGRVFKMASRSLGIAFLVTLLLALPLPIASAQTVQLTGAGASFPYPIYSKWFDEYYRETGVQINYQSIGSGGGVRQLLSRTVDFGASDAPMTDEELAQAERPIVHIPTVIGAVSVVYNIPGVPQSGLKLTPEVLADIFLGEITRWNDPRIQALNPDLNLPNTHIIVARRADASGTTYTFSDYLSAVSEKWAQRVGVGRSLNWPTGLGARGNEGVAALVRQTPGAIGYVEQAYAEQNNLAQAALQNKDGYFVLPSLEGASLAAAGVEMPPDYRVSIVNGSGKDAYPIATFTWLLVYQDAWDHEKGKHLAEFLWWAIHDGQRFAPELNYAPLPDAVVKSLEETLAGLVYNGQPLLNR